MAITNNNGQEINAITFEGTNASQATLNGEVVWSASGVTWSESAWSGSRATGLNQQGTALTGFVLGNATSIVLTSTETPNAGNDRTESVTYSVFQDSQSFSITHNVTQQGVELPVDGTADWSDWVDVGPEDGGDMFTVFGDWGSWQPATAPETQEQIMQTRTRTVTNITTAVTQDQVRVCVVQTAPMNGGAAGMCSNPTARINDEDERTIVEEPQATDPQVPSLDNMGVETRTIDNPSYVPPFTQADVNVPSVSINANTGAVIFKTTYDSGYTDDEGFALTYEVTLLSQASYPTIPHTGTSEERQVMLEVTGEIPGGFQNSGSTFTLTVTQTVTQETLPEPAAATVGTLATAALFDPGVAGTDTFSVGVSPEDGRWRVTSGDPISFSPASGTGDLGSGTVSYDGSSLTPVQLGDGIRWTLIGIPGNEVLDEGVIEFGI